MTLKPQTQSAEEFHLISQTTNAVPPEATQFIWVLSARHTINKEHNNCPIQSITYQTSASSPNEATCDEEDDLQRMKLGIEMAQEVVAKKLKKSVSELTETDCEQHGPSILYNGSPVQNEALRNTLKTGLSSIQLPNYPASKFIIFELPPNQIHTGGQLNALSALIAQDPRLAVLKKKEGVSSTTASSSTTGASSSTTGVSSSTAGVSSSITEATASANAPHVTVVSSAYHISRLRRLFNSKVFLNPFSPETRITFAGVDRLYQRPCAERDCEGESSRITTYFKKGDIGTPLPSDWYNVASLKKWTPLRDVSQMKHNELLHKALDLQTPKEAIDIPEEFDEEAFVKQFERFSFK